MFHCLLLCAVIGLIGLIGLICQMRQWWLCRPVNVLGHNMNLCRQGDQGDSGCIQISLVVFGIFGCSWCSICSWYSFINIIKCIKMYQMYQCLRCWQPHSQLFRYVPCCKLSCIDPWFGVTFKKIKKGVVGLSRKNKGGYQGDIGDPLNKYP